MDLLIDTHVLVWVLGATRRLSAAARDMIVDPEHALCLSAVTAFEFADLRGRGRLPPVADLAVAVAMLELRLIDLPASVSALADTLPDIHRDPADRMLVAHALHADLAIVTADETIRRYPVRTIW